MRAKHKSKSPPIFVLILLITMFVVITGTIANAVLNSKLLISGEAEFNPHSTNKDFSYTGDCEVYIAPMDGVYEIQLWGASGGNTANILYQGGAGAYTRGKIILNANEKIYICVGQYTNYNSTSLNFNGGGSSYASSYYTAGGGATDVRLIGGNWQDTTGLNSRIMVAGGGGGSSNRQISTTTNAVGDGGSGGGLIGYDGESLNVGNTYGYCNNIGATQTEGGITTACYYGYVTQGDKGDGIFGIGGSEKTDPSIESYAHVGGGGGYYGGAGGMHAGASGGSSYISGHTGSVAITSSTDRTPKSGCITGTSDNNCSIHYSNKKFSETVMIDGGGYAWSNSKGNLKVMPNPNGGNYASGIGHTGNGYARITLTNDVVRR